MEKEFVFFISRFGNFHFGIGHVSRGHLGSIRAESSGEWRGLVHPLIFVPGNQITFSGQHEQHPNMLNLILVLFSSQFYIFFIIPI